jgi:hypothetical protein
MNLKGFALGFALVLPATITGVANADRPQPLAGEIYLNGSTVTAYFIGAKKVDTIRLSAQCQYADTGVPWGEAETITVSPTVVTYNLPTEVNGIPIVSCRADLFAVSGGNKITYLDYEVFK